MPALIGAPRIPIFVRHASTSARRREIDESALALRAAEKPPQVEILRDGPHREHAVAPAIQSASIGQEVLGVRTARAPSVQSAIPSDRACRLLRRLL
nr:hypothetical protein [Caballeronia temeraria]